jgi:two-component system LytT family response regulator
MIAETPALDLIGEATNGNEATTLITATSPELIFLDVRLPGRSGIDVVDAVRPAGVVIFTTAFDDYARIAFELGALDYLTKPFGHERLARAFARATPQLLANRARGAVGELATGLTPDRTLLSERLQRAQELRRPVDSIFVRDRGSVIPVAVRDIVRIEADGDFVAVVTRSRRHLVYMNLSDLAQQFDPLHFVRIHRSHVINLNAVQEIRGATSSRVEALLADGARIVASRTGTRALRNRLRNT